MLAVETLTDVLSVLKIADVQREQVLKIDRRN